MPATSPFKIANYNYIFLDTSIILNSHLNLDKLEDFKTAAHNNNDLPQVTEFDKKIKTVKDCQLLLKQIVAHSKTNNKTFKVLVSAITVAEILHLRDGTDVDKMWADIKSACQLRIISFSKSAAEKVKNTAQKNSGFGVKNDKKNCVSCGKAVDVICIKDDYKILATVASHTIEVKEAIAVLTTDSGFKNAAQLFDFSHGSSCFLLNDNCSTDFSRDMFKNIDIS